MSPGANPVTFAPTSTTSPTNSWPTTSGTGMVRAAQWSQSWMCKSVPQIPVLRTAIRTSLIPSSGSGTSSSRNPGPRSALTSARTDPDTSWTSRLRRPDHVENALSLLTLERQPGRTYPFAPEAILLDCELDVLDELRRHVEAEQRRVPAVDLAGLVPRSRSCQLPEALIVVRESESDPGHPPVDPEHRALERKVVDAGEDRQPV